MYLETLHLINFRNYVSQELTLTPGPTLFYGENGQGKTNLLEAVWLLATTKSFRTSRDIELIHWEANQMRIEAKVYREKRYHITLTLTLDRGGNKQVFINQTEPPRVLDLVGELNAVPFWMEDIEICRGEPSLRRRYLNTTLSSLRPHYLYLLSAYRKILGHRNRLLKEMLPSQTLSSLPVWDTQLIEYGSALIEHRLSFLNRLAPLASQFYSLLTHHKERLEIQYAPSFSLDGGVKEPFEEALQRLRPEELQKRVTLIGPHRDDIVFLIQGRDARVYGSLGQQRTIVLALRLAELQIIQEEVSEKPVLLVDDIFAELDIRRVQALLSILLSGYQTLMTTTAPDRLAPFLPKETEEWLVEGGRALRKPFSAE